MSDLKHDEKDLKERVREVLHKLTIQCSAPYYLHVQSEIDALKDILSLTAEHYRVTGEEISLAHKYAFDCSCMAHCMKPTNSLIAEFLNKLKEV